MKIGQWITDGQRWFADSFVKNPAVWLLLGGLALALHGQHVVAKDLGRICELTGEHDVWVGKPTTAKEELDNICISHQPDDLPDDN